MNETLNALLSNDYFLVATMSVIVFILTQFLKLPIKALTAKITKTERARKIANIIIVLLPFAFGLLGEWLYCHYFSHEVFIGISGLSYGAGGISLYGIVERFFNVKIDNPCDTEEGQAVLEVVEKVKEDGKLDSTDIDAIEAFWKAINKE